MEVILKYGANINTLSPEKSSTPFITALESRRGRKLIQKLLACGAGITLGDTPALFAAIKNEEPEPVSAVLDAGADINGAYYSKSGNSVLTPLLAAAVRNDCTFEDIEEDAEVWNVRLAIQVMLLERGANPLMELQGNDTTVLHEIAYYHGLIAPTVDSGVDLEVKDSQGRTPLLVACSPIDKSCRCTRDESTPRELILAGADVHATDSSGSTPDTGYSASPVPNRLLALGKRRLSFRQ